jgi:hypothetical protein
MVLCLGQFQNLDRGDRPCPGSMFNTALPGIEVYQDHYGGHNKKKNGHTCNDAIEIQTTKSR